MPLLPSSSSSAASAVASARLPGFLRPGGVHIDQQKQLFNSLNQQERQRLQAAYSPESPFSIVHAVHESIRGQNRYNDIVPYKHSQILIGASSLHQSPSSFINANRITAPPSLRSSLPANWRGYIATQAPLPQTQSRFWRMVYEQNVHVIVCLTAVSHDRSQRAQKAERYWPLVGETDELDKDLHVRNLDIIDDQEKVAYRHFEIWDPTDTTSKRRQLLLVHYQGWPDHGVPTKSNDLRDILYKIRAWKSEQSHQQQQTLANKDFGPMVVHCSAGCGRTGTFCVIDTVLSVLEQTGYPNLALSPSGYKPNATDVQTISQSEQRQLDDSYDWKGDRDIIYETLSSFRQERMLMVQTAVQYRFCYEVVRDLCE
ncbi:Tyrosine-protein phosphatase non-receptor type 1 [Mortierella sp. AM989]|nr:Tyrosine-protein phosphatase non-receptor type 1 [Mortierella sp. AM989]